MSKLSFFDKLKILVDVSSSSYLFIIALLLVVSLGFIFVTTNKKNAKSSRITYITMYSAIILVTCVIYKDSLMKMFDYMMNNLFIAIYFPNLAIYFAAIIISNIILWISIFNFKINKTIKKINVAVFSIIHYILILIISVINTNKLDVFTQKSVYENKEALGLIELSSVIFVVWILFLVIYKLFRNYQLNKIKQVQKEEVEVLLPSREKEKVEVLRIEKEPLIPSNINIIRHPETIKLEEKEIIKEPLLPENINIIRHPETIKLEEKEIIKESLLPENINIVKHPTSVKTKEIIESVTNENNTIDNLFTLEDYKLVLKLLKDYKEKEKEETQEKLRKIENDQRKYSQIEEFYKNANRWI